MLTSVTAEQFLQGGDLKEVGTGWHVQVLASPHFPHHVVKVYDCEKCNLRHLFVNEVTALQRFKERLGEEPLSRVVFPRLHGSAEKGQFLYEIFPRIYPPTGPENGEMTQIKFGARRFLEEEKYHQAGRGWVFGPPHLVQFFGEEVPLVLEELGKAFALIHFKACVDCRDVEIVVGKASPTDPVQLFLIDFDRAAVLSGKEPREFASSLYSFKRSDVFRDFFEVDPVFKEPFVRGYRETAETLGFGDEAKGILRDLQNSY